MKFTCSIEINKPISKVVQLFENIENLKEWQDGFVSHKHLSGEPGKPGAKSQLNYHEGKRKMELIETIKVNNLPKEKIATYEHIHMVNDMKVSFTDLKNNKTRMDQEIEYTEFRSFVPKVLAFFFPGMFKKQVQKWLNQFKQFAERS